MKIRLISIFTALVLFLSLCACGKNVPGAAPEEEESETPKQIIVSPESSKIIVSSEPSEKQAEEKLVRDPSLKERDIIVQTPTGIYEFDNKTMTVSDVAEWTPIKLFNGDDGIENIHIDKIEYYVLPDFVFFKDGKEVKNGFVEEGMIIRVFYRNGRNDKKFYGEYTVQKLAANEKPDFWCYWVYDFNGEYAKYSQIMCIEPETSVNTVTKSRKNNSNMNDSTYIVFDGNKEVTDGILKVGMEVYPVYKDEIPSQQRPPYIVVYV